jgi:phospholipid/cholesterol/gamma-HCH transport system substrate-binding protein
VQTLRAAGIGAFVILTGLLFIAALFLIGNRRMLFTDTFTVYAEFKTLGGIQVGSQVRVAGMTAGEIKAIGVPSTPAGRFRVRMDVTQPLHGLVRTDSVAVIRTEGLVGAQFVEIGTGTAAAPRLSNGGTIAGQEPFDMADLMKQMSDTIRLVNGTIDDLKDDLQRTIGTIDQTAQQANALLADVSGAVKAISTSGAKVVDDMAVITNGVREGRGTVGRLFNDDTLAQQIVATATDARKSVASLRQMAEQAQRVIADATSKGGSVDNLSGKLEDTLEKARETMDNLAADTEALKRSFLFRGYFNDRGFFSLSDLSPAEYRRGALEKNGRRPLRIWLRADLLFSSEAGPLTLSDEGRQRIDSAMGEFLKYRNTAPLVVEGYADGGSEADRYLRSRERAALVRLYLLERFQLERTTTGTMALGTPTKSPTGDRWDGVALTVFVDGRSLGKE